MMCMVVLRVIFAMAGTAVVVLVLHYRVLDKVAPYLLDLPTWEGSQSQTSPLPVESREYRFHLIDLLALRLNNVLAKLDDLGIRQARLSTHQNRT